MAIPAIVSALGIGVRAWKAYSATKKVKILKKATEVKKAAAKKPTRIRKDKDQPKTGQKEMFNGKAGTAVKRPKGPVKEGWYENTTKQQDLFKKGLEIVKKKHTE